MLAADTDIIVRYFTNDDPRQFPRSRRLVDGNDVFVATTVLLETEWVIRSVYRFTPERTVIGLRAFAGLPNVLLEHPARAARALDWCEQSMDFAEALHWMPRRTVRLSAPSTRISGNSLRRSRGTAFAKPDPTARCKRQRIRTRFSSREALKRATGPPREIIAEAGADFRVSS